MTRQGTVALALILAGIGLGAGCAADPELCCDGYSAASDEGRYCLAHRNAMLRYVRDGAEPAVQKDRRTKCVAFFKKAQALHDEDAIGLAAQNAADMADFWKRYEQEHFWASRDCNIAPAYRARLILEGFRHALRELELDLGPELSR